MVPHAFLAAFVYPIFGKYEKALEEAQTAAGLNPDFAVIYYVLSIDYEYMGRLQEASAALQRATERKLEIPEFSVQRYDIAFLRGDQTEMERAQALGKQKSEIEYWISDHQAFVLAYSGRLQQARRMAQMASDLAQQSARRGMAALYESGAAIWEGFFGNGHAATQRAMAALQHSKERDVAYGAAFALALAGDSRARTYANELEKHFPEDTAVKFSYLPAVRALLALNEHEPARAIELLRDAAPHELGAPQSTFFGFFGALYPVYVRGEAYLVEQRGIVSRPSRQEMLFDWQEASFEFPICH
jgi:eukaryotic-like serine/threonine-protein kinase